MQLGNAHPADIPLRHGNIHVAAKCQGLVVLGNLVALGQVGIKIVFAVKVGKRAQFGMHGSRQQHALFHCHPIEHRQNTGQPAANRANIGIGRVKPGIRLAGAENLGDGIELDVGLQPNDDFIISH